MHLGLFLIFTNTNIGPWPVHPIRMIQLSHQFEAVRAAGLRAGSPGGGQAIGSFPSD